MKRLLMLSCIACSLCVVAKTTATNDAVRAARRAALKEKLSSPEFMERMRNRRIAKEGGRIRNPKYGKGKIVWTNRQNFVPESVFREAHNGIFRMFNVEMPFVTDMSAFTLADIAKLEGKGKPEGQLIFVDWKDFPSTILMAPDGHWAIVNVAALSKDNPSADVLITRTQKEVWRAFAYLFGAADSRQRNCAMHAVNNLSSLDNLPANVFSPEPANLIIFHLSAIGVQPYREATYMTACREGWAPAPTNDVQKAIWEKVKAELTKPPTNPIRIEKK